MHKHLAIGLTILACIIPTASATTTLSLLPGGNIAGAPGSVSGWGFTITNDTNYIEITSAQFCLNPVAFPACDAPLQGTFVDFISQFNDIVVGPTGGTLPTSVTQVFDELLLTGVGSFTFLPGGAIGDSDFGQLVLTYNVFDADPNGLDPANQIGFDQVLVANATATVSPSSATPEPQSALLVVAGIAALTAVRRSLPTLP